MAGRLSSASVLKAVLADIEANLEKAFLNADLVEKAVLKADLVKAALDDLADWRADNAAEVADMHARLDEVVRAVAPPGPVRDPRFGQRVKREAERLEKIAYNRRMADEVDPVTRQGYLNKAAELEAEVRAVEAARALVEREGRR